MAQVLSTQQLGRLLDSLEEQGATLRRCAHGWQVRFPNGEMAVFHFTPSDHRAMRNFRALVRRNELSWPFDRR